MIAIAAGLAVTLQAGLNRYLANDWGLGSAITLNLVITGIMGVAYYLLVHYNILPLPTYMQNKEMAWKVWHWWVLIPSFCGFVIVLGMPWAIIHLGASRTIIIAIAAQILSSLLWDLLVEKNPVRWPQYLGALFTFVGASMILIF